MLAHHDLLLLAQGGASVGLAGWAAAIGARWYAITHPRSRPQGAPSVATAPRIPASQGDER